MAKIEMPNTMTYDEIRGETYHAESVQVADFLATWPNGNDPDGETTVAVNVYGSAKSGGYILVLDDDGCGGDSSEAGKTVYPTFAEAEAAAVTYAAEHDEAA